MEDGVMAVVPDEVSGDDNNKFNNDNDIDIDEETTPPDLEDRTTSFNESEDSGIETRRSETGHVYNSQLFNYDMIVDLMDEVWEEVWQCDEQLVLIENKLRDLNNRHIRLVTRRGESSGYRLRLQIATIEGVKGMYEEYIARKRQKLERLRSYSL